MPKKKKSKKAKKTKKVKTKIKTLALSKSQKKEISVSNSDEKPEIQKIKKQPTEKRIYNLKDYVVYPKHGVGKITAIEKATIGDIDIQFYIPENLGQINSYIKVYDIKGKLIDDMLDYFVDNTYDDLFTVDSKGTRNGSIRITKSQYVKDGTMSRRVGSMLDDCTNIHSEEDLKQAERNIQNNE